MTSEGPAARVRPGVRGGGVAWIGGLLCLGVLCSASGCHPGSASGRGLAAAADARPGAAAVMRGVRVRQYVHGRLQLDLEAAEAWHSRGAEWVSGRTVRGEYRPEGGRLVRLACGEARYEIASRTLRATGSVRVESGGVVLEARELTYEVQRDRIKSEGFVRIREGENVMTGVGLEARTDLKDWIILEPHAVAREPSRLEPLVEGAGSAKSRARGSVRHFRKPEIVLVRMGRDVVTYRGDYARVDLARPSVELHKASVTVGAATVTADRLALDLVANRLVLAGGVTLVEGGTTLTADRAESRPLLTGLSFRRGVRVRARDREEAAALLAAHGL
jgi:LPS export ABC transporter protein LptC